MKIIKQPVISQQGNEYLIVVSRNEISKWKLQCHLHAKLAKPKRSLFGKLIEYEKDNCFYITCSEEDFFERFTDFNQFVETCINMYEKEKAFELKIKRAETDFANGSKSIDFRL